MRLQILLQEGVVFADVRDTAGSYFERKLLGRGAEGGDFDNDGDVDLLVTHLKEPAALLRNDTVTEASWIGFELRQNSRIPPIGARILLEQPGFQRTLAVTAGGSYLSHSDNRLRLGLKDSKVPLPLRVIWPSGHEETLPTLALNRYWILEEGRVPRERLAP